MSVAEPPPPPAVTRPSEVFKQLHENCSRAITQSLEDANAAKLGEAYLFASDLDVWCAAIPGQLQVSLVQTASREYVIAILNVCQGQYRNGFKGLRLVLELCLQSTHLSANLVERAEWLKGEQDTVWATLMHEVNGPLSLRSSGAFFPELAPHVAHYRSIARAVYRELSECIHGNVPQQIPLPTSLEFSKDTFELWALKAASVRLVVHFAFVLRYLAELSPAARSSVEPAVLAQLGHIPAIRGAFGTGA